VPPATKTPTNKKYYQCQQNNNQKTSHLILHYESLFPATKGSHGKQNAGNRQKCVPAPPEGVVMLGLTPPFGDVFVSLTYYQKHTTK